MLLDLIKKNRSYRRFYQQDVIEEDTLKHLVEHARFSPSSRNAQPLKFICSSDPVINEKIFPTLAWAGYLKNWEGPEEGERPSAYIIVLGDKEVTENYLVDHGIAVQSILLGAVEQGFGGCIVGTIKKKKLASVLGIGDRYDILLVLALGRPKEEVVVEEMVNDDVRYWRDDKQVHHVPKRSLDELILKSYTALEYKTDKF
jgi:nitroreductase